jgi:MFS family permease
MRRGQTAAILLDHPAFTWLWSGLFISYLGDQFATIALLWFVLQLTGSGAAVGLVIFLFNFPAIVTGPLLGQLLDRYQPRLVMAFDNAARAVLIAAIPILYQLGVLHLWHIYALALAAGALQPATLVGVRAFIPHLVPDELLDHANALWAGSVQFASLVGPALAGYLVASVGGPVALLVDAASFVIMSVVAFGLPNVQREQRGALAGTRRAWLGFGPLLRLREVRTMTALSVIFFFAYGPLEPALPIYSRDVLKAGAAGFGLLWSGYGVGALLGLFAVGAIAARGRPGIVLATIAILWGLFLTPLLVIHNLYAAMLFFALAGFAWAPYAVIETTILQRLVPADMRGQVFGARATLTIAAAPLGSALGGFLLESLSAPAVIGLSALGCVVAGCLGLLSPVLRNMQPSASRDKPM